MIGCRRRPGKSISQRFATPPWPPTSTEWRQLDQALTEDHVARLIARGVEQLDLTPLWALYAGCGSKPHRPDLMLRIVLFEIQRGRSSPAQWFMDTLENQVLHWLGCGIRPARSVWYEFAFRIRNLLDDWNQQVLHLAQQQGQLTGQRASLDGTCVEAHASRHRLFHQEQLQQRQRVLQDALDRDAQGQALEKPPYWLAKTPQTRRQQQERYRLAQAKLSERLEENQRRLPSQRRDAKQIRVSVTDPEAFLGKDKHKVFRPLYNVQFLRDVDSPFILAYETFARGSDAGTLVPLLQRAQHLVGRGPKQVLADSGYITGLDLADAQRWGIDLYGPWKENDYSDAQTGTPQQFSKDRFRWQPRTRTYRCPQGKVLRCTGVQTRRRSLGRTEKVEIYRADPTQCAACPLKARCCPKARSGRSLSRSEHDPLIEAHRRKMKQPEAQALYKLRRQTVETSFADSKEHRGFRRIHGRGLLKAKIQTALTALVHNLSTFTRALLGAGPPKDGT